MVYDVIIIGAGPAGMSAGIYVCRKQLSALILSEDFGGQMARSWEIENYIGYHLISGVDLAKRFKDHLESFKCLTMKVGQKVSSIKKGKGLFEVNLSSGQLYSSKTVIVATGRKPRMLGVPGESELRGHGVTYCATCDAPFFKDKVVAVVGDGNSALGAAYQLAKIASRVFLFSPKPKFKSDLDKVLKNKVLSFDNVEVVFNSEIKNILGDKVVGGIKYQNIKTKQISNMEVSGIFIEIGSEPSLDFVKKIVKINRVGEIIIDKRNMSSVPGIFAAGGVSDVYEKQIIIAAGEGAKAAISASRYLSSL